MAEELAPPKPAKTSNHFDPAVLKLVDQRLGRVLRKYPTHNFTGGVATAGLDEQLGLRTRGARPWNYVKELRQMPGTHAYRCCYREFRGRGMFRWVEPS